ncbi:flagellar motor protein MotA [Gluconobacter kanchanaburiensis]|uniref:Flagellar motor protein MotA n=1 Tax=Gluconobacter kanchanaburiensis NBRC 103587 TaxID=1307948 RepID=A0A511BDI0_9PROT|nr:flagellar motor protein MotA [Gluconobacter kanchanaburiensis]MBF0861503.1 flagellar motor protein MotA [Gluconobacter kanchanaburiensis]GBR68421.1 MotA/TolQ/ExbB proton channel family protein [Gluconobacter kanchanaburiensis NBRC 103587]GEK95867.1 flagellar motor protein MotA [Gluconobacter kanchanaburiensis NBRC 103587]
MTRPTTYLLRMAAFLVAVTLLTATMGTTLLHAFNANPKLDTIIFGVLLLGILWNLHVVQRLMPEVHWVELLRQPRTGLATPKAPRLLAPMASMLAARNRTDRLTLSTQTTQAMLDSLSSRLDESREISRYMTQLLIFLGLLGTFYGLLLTVSSIAGVIGNMSAGSGDMDVMFNQLKTGLAGPLAGMSTAFSGSMFGLAGALVLGFLDLTAGQAQTRFFNELEEWLAGVTRVTGSTSIDSDGAPVPAYVQALLEQTAENLETLQNAVSRSEENRVRELHMLDSLQERLRGMTDLLAANQTLMTRAAETQTALLRHIGDDGPGSQGTALLRIETHLSRLIQEMHEGRAQTIGELRNDLRVLARTIAAASGNTTPPPGRQS